MASSCHSGFLRAPENQHARHASHVRLACAFLRPHSALLSQEVVLRSPRIHSRCMNYRAMREYRVYGSSVSVSTQTELLRWLEGRNLAADKQACRPDAQKGLVATRLVPRSQPLLSVPSSLWITTETVSSSAIGRAVARLPPWLQIALFLLYESSQPNSSWTAYLDTLPPSIDSPIFWNDADLECLSGTQLLEQVIGYREFFDAKYEELQETLFGRDRHIFGEQAFSKEAFTRAVSIVRARVHAPLEGDRVALAPLADLVSHQRGAGAALTVKSGGFGRVEAAVLEAQREFQPGDAVTMDFGPDKLDSQLLLDYGVFDDFVSRAGFPLTLGLPEDDRFVDDKADILEVNELSTSQEFLLRPDEEPSETMLAFLRLVNLQGQDAFLLESLFRNEAWGHLLKPVSLDNEQAVYTSMMEGCREALSAYGSSIAEDKAMLRSAEAGSRRERALRVRIGEKEALSSMLAFFEDRYERLESIEYYQERRLKNLGLLDDDGRTTYDGFFKDGIA